MTLGKGFLGALLGCALSFLLVVGLQVTGRDSPSEITTETKMLYRTFAWLYINPFGSFLHNYWFVTASFLGGMIV